MSRFGTMSEAARQTPVIDQVDVLVAGGGPAGIAAALAAARGGARTMLAERFGYLGGMITGANVVAVLGCGDGYVPKARGVTLEIRQRLEEFGAVTATHECGDYSVDAEVLKWQAAELLLEAGVSVRLHTLACEPVMEGGCVTGVLMESKSGRQAVRATVVIDGTADADLAWRAGCRCDNATHEVTLVLSIAGVDQQQVEEFSRRSPEEYQAAVDKAMRLNGGVMLGRTRLLKGIDVTDAVALTQAEIQLRRECFAALTHLKAHMPGYQDARVGLTFPQLGVRLSRRVRGEYVLADDDLKSSRHFEDGIARLGVYFPDWGPTYAIQGLDYDLPYRCLVPETVDGLLVVGRCVSADYVTANTLRLIVPCLATGQAGGAAAAIAARDNCSVRGVPVPTLRAVLLSQDVFLG
jgi:ribulose 1,5-bisphosphate synthetase/thiazole synthase